MSLIEKQECSAYIGDDARRTHSCTLEKGHIPKKHECTCGRKWYKK